MASSGCIGRYSWTVGIINGVLAVLLLNAAMKSLSTGLVWLVPWQLGIPWGVLAAWRGSVYVRELLHGQPLRLRGLAEGFGFMAAVMLWDLIPDPWAALMAGFDVAWVGIILYSVVAGLFGAGIAGLLLAFDLVLVETFSPIGRLGGAS